MRTNGNVCANRYFCAALCGFAAAGVFIATMFSAHAENIAPKTGLNGVWLTGDGSTRVRFEQCGANLCGRIVWLREPVDPATRQPWLDSLNEKPSLRQRPLVGLAIVTALKPEGGAAWSGSLYNPLDGKTYTGGLRLLDASRLELSGCVLSIFCQTETWTRNQ